jgi:putative membrane protein
MNSLYSSVDKLQSSINQIANGSSLIKENMDVVVAKLEEIKTGATSIDNGLTQIIAELKKAEAKLNEANVEEQFSKLETLTKTNTETITKLTNSGKTIATTYLDTSKGYDLSKMSYTQIEAMEPLIGKDNVNNLISVKYQYENMSETNKNLLTLIGTNNQAIASLKGSLETTKTEISTLITTLSTYLTQLETGTSTLSTGIGTLKQGVETLNSKMGELNTGINTFNSQGINKITSYAYRIKQVSGKVDALVKLSENYNSFSITDKNTKSNTKFVLVVDGKNAPKEEKKTTTTKKKTSFWDRLVNLFK